MDRFEAMSILIEVVDGGSLSAAGRALRMPLPTVSRKISDLEAMLGTKLLLRSTRRLTLTDAGETYVAAARRLLDDLRAAEREAAGEMLEPRGDLVVTAPVMFGRLHVLPVVTAFLGLYPQINVSLMLGDRNLTFGDDPVDMAVRIGALADSSLVATKLGTMRSLVCASPRLFAHHPRPLRPADIAGLPCILNDTAMNRGGWAFRLPESGAIVNVDCHPRLRVSTAEAAMEAAREGVGLARLFHYQVADALTDGSLEAVLEDFETPPVPVHVVHAPRGRLPLKMRCFMDHAVPQLRRRLAQA